MIINFSKHFFIELSTNWSQLRGKYNWYAFTLINIYLEKDAMTFAYELHLSLLGFTLMARYNTDESLALFDKWDKEIEEGPLYKYVKVPKKRKKKVKKTKK